MGYITREFREGKEQNSGAKKKLPIWELSALSWALNGDPFDGATHDDEQANKLWEIQTEAPFS